MLYIIDKNQAKEVTATNRNIDKLRKKKLYSIREMFGSTFAVFKWNEHGFWQQISKNYIDKGWALRFLKKQAERSV